MFNCFHINSKVVPEKILNEGNCHYCNKKNYYAVTNDGDSITKCLKCNKTFTLCKYVDANEQKENIHRENYDIFLSKTSNSSFI